MTPAVRAVTLALVGGYVDAVGYVMLRGVFPNHVTGNLPIAAADGGVEVLPALVMVPRVAGGGVGRGRRGQLGPSTRGTTSRCCPTLYTAEQSKGARTDGVASRWRAAGPRPVQRQCGGHWHYGRRINWVRRVYDSAARHRTPCPRDATGLWTAPSDARTGRWPRRRSCPAALSRNPPYTLNGTKGARGSDPRGVFWDAG